MANNPEQESYTYQEALLNAYKPKRKKPGELTPGELHSQALNTCGIRPAMQSEILHALGLGTPDTFPEPYENGTVDIPPNGSCSGLIFFVDDDGVTPYDPDA